MLKQLAESSNDDKDLRCSICHYFFSEITKPYLLKCNHNLCLKCINNQFNKNNLLICPICKVKTYADERKNLQVNFAFLSLLSKLLLKKAIFCKKCYKIFSWSEHHKVCDEKHFQETNEILIETSNLADECKKIIELENYFRKLLDTSKENISKYITNMMDSFNIKFTDNLNASVEKLFNNILFSKSKDKLIIDTSFENNFQNIKKFIGLYTQNKSKQIRFDKIDSKEQNNFNNFNKQNLLHKRSDSYSCIKQISKVSLSNSNNNSGCNGSITHRNVLSQSFNHSFNQYYSHSYHNHNHINNNKYLQKDSPIKTDKEFNLFKLEEYEENLENTENVDNIENLENIEHENFSSFIGNKHNIASSKINEPNKSKANISTRNYHTKSDKEFENVNHNNRINHIIINNVNNNVNDTITSNEQESSCNEGSNINSERDNEHSKDNENSKDNNNGDDENEEPIVFEDFNPNICDTILTNDPDDNSLSTENVNVTSSDLIHNMKIINKLNQKVNNLHSNNSKTSKSNKNSYNDNTIQTKYDSINKIIGILKKTKDTLLMIKNYGLQLSRVTEVIKEKLNINFNTRQEQIFNLYKGIIMNLNKNDRINKKLRYMVNYIENSTKVWLFDSKNKTSEIKEFNGLSNSFHKLSQSIEFDDNDKIFITGGKYEGGFFSSEEFIYSNLFIVLRWSTKSIELSIQMPRKSAYHSSLYFLGKLYIIGGEINENTKMKDCFCYNFFDKMWELLPQLNYAKCASSLCMFNSQFLYAFRGYALNNKYLDTIEVLNIDELNNGWQIVKIEDPGKAWATCAYSCVTVVNSNMILICGGVNNTTKDKGNDSKNDKYVYNTYYFDPLKKSIYRGKDLVKPAMFNTWGIVANDKVYNIDYRNESNRSFGVHIYDINENVWSFN